MTTSGETVTYKTGKTNAHDFIARNVIYYVKDEGDNTDPILVLVRNNTNSNTELTVAQRISAKLLMEQTTARCWSY